jgi:acyl-CoA thioester hydrolase
MLVSLCVLSGSFIRYNEVMTIFNFFHPVEVRYGDLDAQQHVNNAKYLTYMEQARLEYLRHLGLWSGGSFAELGMIVAEVQITYRAPIHYGEAVRVGVRVSRLGNKSMRWEYSLENAQDGSLFATATSVQVSYDYAAGKSMPVPDGWRKKIMLHEGINDERGSS